jgi:phage terminase Nu1 subunit (DNA packaging protein)
VDRLILSREELAELWGIGPLTVDSWTAQGMPALDAAGARVNGSRGRARRDWSITRKDLAAMWDVHPDTLTRWMREGLAGAVVAPGGRSEEMRLDLRLAHRWKLAKDRLLQDAVLDDFRVHGAASCLAIAQLSAGAVCGLYDGRRTKRTTTTTDEETTP